MNDRLLLSMLVGSTVPVPAPPALVGCIERVEVTASADGGTGFQITFGPRVHELLPGWVEDWVVFERERFRQLSLQELEHVATQACLAGQYAVALDLALLAVHGDPLRESARQLVIEVHLAEGNRGAAVLEYRRFNRLLVDQLGIAPSPELVRLIDGPIDPVPVAQPRDGIGRRTRVPGPGPVPGGQGHSLVRNM